jgi:hypothetical protein
VVYEAGGDEAAIKGGRRTPVGKKCDKECRGDPKQTVCVANTVVIAAWAAGVAFQKIIHRVNESPFEPNKNSFIVSGKGGNFGGYAI